MYLTSQQFNPSLYSQSYQAIFAEADKGGCREALLDPYAIKSKVHRKLAKRLHTQGRPRFSYYSQNQLGASRRSQRTSESSRQPLGNRKDTSIRHPMLLDNSAHSIGKFTILLTSGSDD